MAKIIESAENLTLETVVTVRAERGDEYVVNADRLAMAMAECLSEIANDRQFGWIPGPGYYDSLFAQCRNAALTTGAMNRGKDPANA